MSERPRRYLQLVPLGATQAAGLVCGVIGVRWSSALVPPEVLGVFGLLLTVQHIGPLVTHPGLVTHVQRYWTPATPARPYVRLLLAAAGPPTLWLAGGLAGALLVLNLSAEAAIPAAWWFWMLAINLFAVMATVAHAALQAEQRYWAGFWVSTVGAASRSFLPPLLAMTIAATLGPLGGGYLAHTVIWAATAAWCVRRAWTGRPGPLGPEVPSPRDMIRTFVWVSLLGWLAATSPRWFAALALSPEATGYFMLAANLAMIVPAAVNVIAQSYSFPPLFAAARAGAGPAELQRMTGRTIAGVLLAGQGGLLALAWAGPHLVGPVVDPRYAPSMDWLLGAGGAILASVTGPFFANLLLARNRERDCLRLAAASAALRVGIMAGLVAGGSEHAFRLGLALLPWPTVLLEYLICRRLLRAGSGGGGGRPAGSTPGVA